MSYATRLLFVLASLSSCHDEVRNRLEKLFDERKDNFESIVLKFVAEKVTPTSTFHFEQRIGEEARELAPLLIEDVYNALEPDDPGRRNGGEAFCRSWEVWGSPCSDVGAHNRTQLLPLSRKTIFVGRISTNRILHTDSGAL